MSIFTKISVLSSLSFLTMNVAMGSESLEDELRYLRAEALITTASRYAEKISDTPASVVLITSQQIKQRRYLSLQDLLKDLPSVDERSRTSASGYNAFTFRGHRESNKLLILQDGVRIDSPTGEKLPIATNFPLYHAKRVEILYGPAAAVYGTEAFGGVINIITQEAEDIDGAKVGGSFGSYDGYTGYFHAGKRFNDDFAVSIGGHFQGANYADLAKEYPNDYVKEDAITFDNQVYRPASERENFTAPIESRNFFAKLKFGKNFQIGYNQAYFDHPTNTGERYAGVVYDEKSHFITQIDSVYAKYHFEINSDLSTDSNFYYSRYEIDSDSAFRNIFGNFEPVYKYAFGEKWALEQQFQYRFNQQHKLSGGLLYEDFYSIPKTADLAQPYDADESPDKQNDFYIGTNNEIPIKHIELNYYNLAGYVQLQSSWHKTFSTMLGLRYDYGSRYGGTFNPRLGFVYKPFASTTLKVLYGESFRAPSPLDTNESIGGFTGEVDSDGKYISTFFQSPATDLKPEKARTLEFEISYAFNQNNYLSLSGYYTKLSDLIDNKTETTPTQFIPNAAISRTKRRENIGSADIYGLELNGNYLAEINDNWKLNFWGNYSYIDGFSKTEGDNGKLELESISPHKLKLGATLSYQEDYFATLKWRIISNSHTGKVSSSDESQLLNSPSYNILDLHLGAKIYQGLSANIDIYNLLDTRYYGASSGGVTKFLFVPQPLRAVMFSLQYQF